MNEIVFCLKPHIDRLLEKQEPVIIAIDGNCTAGKTTLAAALEQEYHCNVFHMDDFFLRPEQRTPARYAQPGGNVDYERFREEVLEKLKQGSAFSYRPFDCGSFTLSDAVEVQPRALNIVEGTYCMHPYFGDVYDLKVFLAVTSELQAQRIRKRPAYLHQRFSEEWIPMEKLYFDHFKIRQGCDVLFGPDASECINNS